MGIDRSLFEEALTLIEFNYKSDIIKVTDKTIDFFEYMHLSDELIDFFQQFSFRHEIEFNGIYFNCVNKIRTENLEEVNKEIYKNNLLIIGSWTNGDPIVLDTKIMSIWYVFHDQLWESEYVEDPRSMYIDLQMSIGEFFYKSLTEDSFPVDAYEAKEYIQEYA